MLKIEKTNAIGKLLQYCSHFLTALVNLCDNNDYTKKDMPNVTVLLKPQNKCLFFMKIITKR